MLERPPNVVPWNCVAVGKICWPRKSSSSCGAACAGAAPSSATASSRTSLVTRVLMPGRALLRKEVHRERDCQHHGDEGCDGEVDTAEREPRGALALPALRLLGELVRLPLRIGHLEAAYPA